MPADVKDKGLHAEVLLRQQYKGARVLLAEDNMINQEVALDLLRDVGLEVDVAENGSVALEKIAQHRYDLVLMDVQMPELDGMAATRLLRAQANHADLPVLAMTANAFEEDRKSCLEAGMNDFVPKPVVPELLYAKLLRWLSKDAGQANIDLEDWAPAPVAEATDNVAKQLQSVPGLESMQALRVLKGDVRKYRHLLAMFADSHVSDMKKVLDLIAVDNIPEAQRLAHGLKGVAGVLGAREVLNTVKALDAALRQNASKEELGRLAEACDAEIGALSSAIRAMPEEADASGFQNLNVDPQRIKQVLGELKRLLQENNARASSLVRISTDVLQAALGSGYAGFAHQIDVFDYEGALQSLLALAPPEDGVD